MVFLGSPNIFGKSRFILETSEHVFAHRFNLIATSVKLKHRLAVNSNRIQPEMPLGDGTSVHFSVHPFSYS